eukprot:Blabericola_migrator_1__10769@NODE_617_length_7255_cov_83_500696_g450_i0_p3_GENE_NODE_617_length_7255_cov_83_500696_g450_i0NODE_617_length_7255_cov_83_500696_g450_i0_p3_ORF_typecomplete_len348_score66_91SRAP/PF02586_14/6_7e45_NODE_617_length_7255_cov_83_500696_g450_i053876430
MCGRVCCALTPVAVLHHANCDVYDPGVMNYNPKYNGPPQSGVLVAYETADDEHTKGVDQGVRVLALAKWSLQPSFVSTPSDKSFKYRTFNARLEDVERKPLYTRLLNKKRCLIFTNGFYEWQQNKERTPFYFTYADNVHLNPVKRHKKTKKIEGSFDARAPTHKDWKLISELTEQWEQKHPIDKQTLRPITPLCFAGLYDICVSNNNSEPPMISCTMFTMPSRGTPMAKIHNRMPCVLSPEMASKWCSADPALPFHELKKEVEADCRHTMKTLLKFHQVTKDVGNVKNQGPHLIEKVGEAPGTEVKKLKDEVAYIEKVKEEPGISRAKRGRKTEDDNKARERKARKA